MRSLKSRKQFKHRKRQSSKKRMKNKKRKLSKRLRGGVSLDELYNSMEQLGDEIKTTTNIDRFSRLIKEGDVLARWATQRQNQNNNQI